jgi:hypothetical protein
MTTVSTCDAAYSGDRATPISLGLRHATRARSFSASIIRRNSSGTPRTLKTFRRAPPSDRSIRLHEMGMPVSGLITAGPVAAYRTLDRLSCAGSLLVSIDEISAKHLSTQSLGRECLTPSLVASDISTSSASEYDIAIVTVEPCIDRLVGFRYRFAWNDLVERQRTEGEFIWDALSVYHYQTSAEIGRILYNAALVAVLINGDEAKCVFTIAFDVIPRFRSHPVPSHDPCGQEFLAAYVPPKPLLLSEQINSNASRQHILRGAGAIALKQRGCPIGPEHTGHFEVVT